MESLGSGISMSECCGQASMVGGHVNRDPRTLEKNVLENSNSQSESPVVDSTTPLYS